MDRGTFFGHLTFSPNAAPWINDIFMDGGYKKLNAREYKLLKI